MEARRWKAQSFGHPKWRSVVQATCGSGLTQLCRGGERGQGWRRGHGRGTDCRKELEGHGIQRLRRGDTSRASVHICEADKKKANGPWTCSALPMHRRAEIGGPRSSVRPDDAFSATHSTIHCNQTGQATKAHSSGQSSEQPKKKKARAWAFAREADCGAPDEKVAPAGGSEWCATGGRRPA